MNILYVAHERKMGGASLSLVTMVEEMQKRGHKVAVVVPFYFSPVAKELRYRHIRTYWVFYGWWMQPRNWPFYMKIIFKILYVLEEISASVIAGIVKNGSFQIIHSNSSVIDVGSKAAKKAGCSHIWHFREFAELFYDFEYVKGRERSITYLKDTKDWKIFVSEELLKFYKELEGTERAQVIYNGVGENYLNFHEHINKKMVFLVSGNFAPSKRQDLVLEAVLELKNKGAEDFELWIAGTAGSLQSSKEYEKKLKEYATKNGLTEVKFLGRVANMNDIRRKSDVEIIASNMEAFGRVTVEAMLSGNPVLASNSGANPELIDDGKCGYLFECGDASALAEQMNYLLNNPEVVSEMGNYAYQFAKDRFMLERNTEAIERLYESIENKEDFG